jgi:hypothetical protein
MSHRRVRITKRALLAAAAALALMIIPPGEGPPPAFAQAVQSEASKAAPIAVGTRPVSRRSAARVNYQASIAY